MRVMRRIYQTIALSRWGNPPRLLVDRLVATMARSLPRGARILDAGAGEASYAPAFAHCHYIACDRGTGDTAWDYTRLSVVADIAALPFVACAFDAILCTQVLEHVGDPQAVLCELAAVLKPGGSLYLSVPFLGDPLHQEPYDFYRYTKYSLRYLLEKVGLSPIHISPMGGVYFLICCYLWWAFILYEESTKHIEKSNYFKRALYRKIIRSSLLLCSRLSTLFVIRLNLLNIGSDKFTYGYIVVAKKDHSKSSEQQAIILPLDRTI